MNHFEFAGAKIAFEDLGAGRPVILVHGAIVANPWGKFKPLMAKSHRVIAVHLPGFGRSETVLGRVHDTDLFAQVICQLARKLKIQDAPVIALSLGTIITLKAAQKGCLKGALVLAGMPTRVGGLMVWMGHIVPRWILRKIIRIGWIREKILMAALRINLGPHREEMHWSRTFAEKVNKTSPEALVDVDYIAEISALPHIVAEVKNRKIFIYGELDLQKDGATAWGLDFSTIKDGGHDVFSDQPELTLGRIIEASRLFGDSPPPPDEN